MKESLKKIKLVDIFIIIVLIILLANASFSIFSVEDESRQIASKLDLAFRTTLSSIIGYILSSNFISNKVKFKTKCDLIIDDNTKAEKKKEQNIQLIIIGTVAIVCLLVLLTARHFFIDVQLNRINIALLTDICVGCIGFLIGYTD